MGWSTETTKIHTISCNTPDCNKKDDIKKFYKKDAEEHFKRRGWGFLKYGHKCPDCVLKEM